MAEWSGRPAYLQVADDLRAKIRTGRIVPGAQLSSLPELMTEYGVSITVIRSALGVLRSEGLAVTHQGKGSFVRDPLPDEPPSVGDDTAYRAIMQRLDQLTATVQHLETRLADLESVRQPE